MIASNLNSPVDNVFNIPNGKMRETANQLASRFANQLPTPGTAIKLDLRNVDFVGSEDLGALVILNKRLRAAGAQLSLMNVQPVVSQVLSITRLDTILKVQNTVAA